MNAAETIQAAIDKLERLERSSTRGRWTAAAGFDENRNLEYSLIAQVGFDFFDVLDAVNEDTHMASADADLVEVLHRTIDAQLAVLRTSQGMVREGVGVTVVNDALDLARAILGDDS